MRGGFAAAVVMESVMLHYYIGIGNLGRAMEFILACRSGGARNNTWEFQTGKETQKS